MKQTNFTKLSHLKDAILQIVSRRQQDLNIKQISWALNLKGSQYQKKIKTAIKQLITENHLIEKTNYKFAYNNSSNQLIGIIDINSSGNGYVSSELYNDDIFIRKKNRLNSLNQDTVSVELIKRRNNKSEGIVRKIISRHNTKFIGKIESTDNNSFFIPDDIKVGSDFYIPKADLQNATNNNRVIVEFIKWPILAGCPFGKVIKILDTKSSLRSEIETSIEVFNIRNLFSRKVKNELKLLSADIKKSDLVNRRDFRSIKTFTIDPDDAKDFDDAISIEFITKNRVSVGIHIADVSHYVKPNSEIDKEAFLRAFSVYFPGQVIPMLPEKLSNIICSLRPKEDKLSFSVVVEIVNSCEIQSIWMGKGIINSNKKFTYSEANKILSLKKGGFIKELTILNKIAENLRNERIKNGSIEFKRSDVVFKLDKNNEPIGVSQKVPLKTHGLIEEFMLLANKLVANKLSSLRSSIYRIHDKPNQDKINEINIYLKNISSVYTIPESGKKNPAKIINKLLKSSKESLNNIAVENLILRSMSKAIYSTKNIGHFGLSFNKYTHFTSPIRRYADLIIHRTLDKYLNKTPNKHLDLDKKCGHFSNTEKLYLNIERKTTKFIQLKLLETKIGSTFHGFISGLTKWGIYIELENGQGEGLVSINDLKDDKYYYNNDLHIFIGRRSGNKYYLGQEIQAEIKAINLYKKEMDLLIIS